MTISTTGNSITYICNGSTTVFAYNFYVQDASTLIVTTVDTLGFPLVISQGLYTITNIGNANGGNVLYTPASGPLPTGYKLVISRVVDLLQPTAIANNDTFYSTVVEKALDKLTMMVQQLNATLNYVTTALASLGVYPPEMAHASPAWAIGTNSSKWIGDTRNFAPAVNAESQSSGDSTVPAPTNTEASSANACDPTRRSSWAFLM